MGTRLPLSARPARPYLTSSWPRSARGALRRARGAFGFIAIFLLWYTITAAGWVKPIALASPAATFDVLVLGLRNHTLLGAVAVSLGRLLLSVIVAGALGIVFGVAVGISRRFALFVEPLAGFFNAISGIVWLPLAIVWFGLSWKTVLFVIGNSVFFVVFFNTLVGIRAVPRLYEQAVLTLGASPWQMLCDVLLPGALPGIIAGARLGLGFGWRALIAAEMVAATQGLGFMIFSAAQYLRTDVILAGILVIGVVAFILDTIVIGPIERATVVRWGMYN